MSKIIAATLYIYKIEHNPADSVADLGCLSRILIFTYSGSKISNKREGRKRLLVMPPYL
jgi:hypothetical protein